MHRYRLQRDVTPWNLATALWDLTRIVRRQRVDVYVTEQRSIEEWKADGTLVDVRGNPTPITLRPGGILEAIRQRLAIGDRA